jgi:recombination protein RecT
MANGDTAKQGDLGAKLETKAATAAATKAITPADNIASYLERMKPQISKALPKHITPDRLARVALTTIRTNPKLLACTTESLMAGVMLSAQLGLEPGPLGHCYLVPYGSEAQFIIGYRGMIDLARRSGTIQSIEAHEVYTNDHFELEFGLNTKLVHVPWHVRTDKVTSEQGSFRGCYVVAKFSDGGYQVHYMPKAEIDAHRKRSKASENGPWVTDYIEMAKKTVVRAVFKWLPISTEDLRRVEQYDEQIATGRVEATDDGLTIDVAAEVTPG